MVLDIPGGLFEQRDVRETPAGSSSSTSSTSILAPIGAIMPWLKSYTNTPQALPTGWVECDGATVSDGDSVYDGQVLPDLNGGEFIRGFTTSGGTGGSDTMAHTHTGTASGTTGNENQTHTHALGSGSILNAGNDFASISGNENITHGHSFSDGFTTSGASNEENRPSYYNVVWIIRIK